MDRRRAQLRRFLLPFAAVALLGGPATAAQPLRAAEWLAPGADAVAALTRRPAECLALPDDDEAALAVETGRAAFRTRLLLGGQAARAGLSCNSCHLNGHGNPDFFFPGLSGEPGTADVTSSLMSEVRGDGAFNPKPIPTLTGAEAPAVSRAPDSGALEAFIHGLVAEEFAGPAPSPAALAGLGAYVRALSPAACPDAATEPVTLAADMDDARRAIAAAQGALAAGDGETGALMLAAARSMLGDIADRYAGAALAGERAALAGAAAALGDVRLLARDDPQAAGAVLAEWPERLSALEAELAPGEGRSLYDPETLRAALTAEDAR